MKNGKKILLIAATHGDEKIGLEVVESLEKRGYGKWFDCLVANPRALRRGRRFIDADLNRSYPGAKISRFYEERKAYENFKIARQYDYAVDFHEADKGTDNFIIVPKENLSGNFPVGLVDLKKLLLWPDPRGPLGQVLSRVVELEFGTKDKKREEVVEQAVKIAEKFITAVSRGKYADGSRFGAREKEIYYVYGKLSIGDGAPPLSDFEDFRKIKAGKEEFYPLLAGQYLDSGILCYKMRRLKKGNGGEN